MTNEPGAHATPDEELVRRVQRGETQLFGEIFNRHYGRLERFARQLGVPEGELEDVLAETFVRAFARVDRFDVASGARYVSYLYSVARNLITDRHRRQGRAPEFTMLQEDWAEPVSEDAPPMELVLRRDDVDRIRRAMGRLNASDREIITLSYDRELTCREIMTVMGKPSVSAVTTHLHKAMRRLRELVLTTEAAATPAGGGGASRRSGTP